MGPIGTDEGVGEVEHLHSSLPTFSRRQWSSAEWTGATTAHTEGSTFQAATTPLEAFVPSPVSCPHL